MTEQELAILKALPENIKFVSRDDQGDLWCTEMKPDIVMNEDDKKYIHIFAQPMTLDNTYSLAVFNHIFSSVEKCEIVELLDA